MKPLSILHLNTERGWRGGERQTFLLARELARRGHRNVVACRPGEALDQKCRDAGLETFPVSPWSELAIWEAGRLRRFLRSNRVEILHAHTGHAVGLGALAFPGGGARLVATRRVDFPVRGGPGRWKYGRPAAWAAVSQSVASRLIAAGVAPARVRVIPSGVDSAAYPSRRDRDRLRRDRGIDSATRVILHAGALDESKDQATLLRAFARIAPRLADARLLILGDGPLRGALAEIARKEGVAERVSFLGHRADVLEYMALADLVAFPSRKEGLGTVLLDALAIGVPTAATATGGIPDIYGSPTAPELSPVGDATAFAANLERGLDPDEGARRVARGRERVGGFTVTAMADAYERFYDEVICRDSPRF
ncbi:MAG: glycosyltransferase [Elusimicrobia bacterium]|nr:glycosyltransferase [Elusimicrobiota bacterium]MBP8004219.1 glycosyltransferase [Elusimicrobiota bacterium]